MGHALNSCFNRDRVILRDGPFSTGRHSSGGLASGIPAVPLLLASCTGRKTAELLTLFCRVCSLEASGSQDLPLVSVLRDTLGDSDPKNDRVFYVWFLTSSRPSFGQRLLSAVPFSYWRVGAGSQNVNVTPRIDLSAPAPDCTRIVFWLSLVQA